MPLDVVDAPRWGEHVQIDAGAASWDVRQGLFYPVVSGDETVGFVVIGPGEALHPWVDRAEAWYYADRMGLSAPEARGEAQFDLALSIGARPEDANLWTLPRANVDGDGVSYVGPDGRETVVVTAFDYRNAFVRAKEAVRTRSAALARAKVDPETLLALERVEPIGRWLGEVHTERRYTPLLEPAVRTFDDRWLSFSVDPRGLVDPDRPEIVFVHGLGDEDRPRWFTLTGLGEPAWGPIITRGTQNLSLTPEKGIGRAADVEAEAILSVAGDGRVLPLVVHPYRAPQVPGAFYVPESHTMRALAGEAELARIPGVYGPWSPEGAEVGLFVLPSGTDRVRLEWTDTWPVSHALDMQAWASYQVRGKLATTQGIPEWVELGRRITGLDVWPSAGPWGPRYPAELRVETTMAAWIARSGADTEELPDQGAGRWWRMRGTDRFELAFGELKFDTYASARGFPEIRVDREAGEVGTPVFLRAIMNFVREHLPPFPHDRLQVVRAPERPIIDREARDPEAYVTNLPPDVSGSPGMLVVHGRRFLPLKSSGVGALPVEHPVERGFAEALTRQWFDDLSFGPRDEWIPAAFGVYFRDRFVYEAYGAKAARDWRAWQAARVLEDEAFPRQGARPLALGPQPWAGEVGGVLLHDLLEPRIGERAILAGLTKFLRDGEPTTEALERALTEASGVPLDAFFDAWLVAGVRPALSGTATRTDGGLRIEVTADPPWGELDVPVRISSGKLERQVWMRVKDGRGVHEELLPGAVRKVTLDPRDALGQRKDLPITK